MTNACIDAGQMYLPADPTPILDREIHLSLGQHATRRNVSFQCVMAFTWMGHFRALNVPKISRCHYVTVLVNQCTSGSSDGDQEAIQAHGERWLAPNLLGLYSELRYHIIESEQRRTGGVLRTPGGQSMTQNVNG